VAKSPLVQRNRRPLQDALAALNDLTKIPLGVLLINQSRTVHRPLAAFADMVLEVACGGAGVNLDQRRQLRWRRPARRRFGNGCASACCFGVSGRSASRSRFRELESFQEKQDMLTGQRIYGLHPRHQPSGRI
jgi:hypothetical protein